ncbi:MAG TPA: hypothetical protein VF491_25585 [Vicinamibacterales bacterium]
MTDRRPHATTTNGYLAVAMLLLAVVALRAHSQSAASPPRLSPQHAESLFTHSENCVACHNQLTTGAGEDVSIGTAWRSTIMANAARDPYFFASLRRETIDHPSHGDEIQDECASCHLPIARKTALAGGRHVSILPAAGHATAAGVTPLTRDGVSCTVCHQIAPDGLGELASFNGNFAMRPSRPDGVRDIFGPFPVDAGRHTIMRSATGFEQVETTHVRQSEFCATCHTLITKAYDRDGRVIGSLPEQMNYQEWQHSAFATEQRSCQSCHMPRTEGPVRVSSTLGADREGLSRHAFVGGNAFMLRLLNKYRDELGVTAPSAGLEATARLTERQLRTDTAEIDIMAARQSPGTLEFDVAVRNLTGHKFPTGYPSRRAWVHAVIADGEGRTIFESGAVSATGAIAGNDSDGDATAFEPHYDVIERAEQVPIYESIMGNSDGRPTTGLLSAVKYLKDNRLLPRGFDKQTASSDIGVVGDAGADATFVGGGDRIHYRISVGDGVRVGRITVELLYQPIAYRWANNLSDYRASAEPARFVAMFDSVPNAASLVASATWRP